MLITAFRKSGPELAIQSRQVPLRPYPRSVPGHCRTTSVQTFRLGSSGFLQTDDQHRDGYPCWGPQSQCDSRRMARVRSVRSVGMGWIERFNAFPAVIPFGTSCEEVVDRYRLGYDPVHETPRMRPFLFLSCRNSWENASWALCARVLNALRSKVHNILDGRCKPVLRDRLFDANPWPSGLQIKEGWPGREGGSLVSWARPDAEQLVSKLKSFGRRPA